MTFYPSGAVFYKGEYLAGARTGFGARWGADGSALDHLATPSPKQVGHAVRPRIFFLIKSAACDNHNVLIVRRGE